MMGDNEERLFIIIPTDREILCKWFGLLSLYGFHDDCKFLEQLLTTYSKTPIVYNSYNPLYNPSNAAYIELLNKAVVIKSTRGVLSDALQKLPFGSTSNSQSHSHSNSLQRTSQSEITIAQSAPAFKQDSDHGSLLDEFDPPFEHLAPEIKIEVDDSASLASENISHAEPIATIRDCSVVLTRLPDTLTAKFKAISTFSRSSSANKAIQLPPIPMTTHSVNPGLVIFGDLHNCLQSKPTAVSTESRISVTQPSHGVQSKSQIERPFVNWIQDNKNRGGRPRYTPYQKPDRLVLIAPKPTLVPFVAPDYTPAPTRKYVKKNPLKSKSERIKDKPLVIIIPSSQVNNTVSEQSSTQISTAVRVPIEQAASSEIGLEMEVSVDPFTITTDSEIGVNSQIPSTLIQTADVNMHLSPGVPGEEHELLSALQVNPADLVQDEELCDSRVPYDEEDDFFDQSEMPELGSDRIFSPVPPKVKIDLVEDIDEKSDAAGGRDLLVTLGGSKEQLIEVVPDEGATGLVVSKSSKTYGRTPVRGSSRPKRPHFSGKDYHQMKVEPNRKATTLDLVDFNGEKIYDVDSRKECDTSLMSSDKKGNLGCEYAPSQSNTTTDYELSEIVNLILSDQVEIVCHPVQNEETSAVWVKPPMPPELKRPRSKKQRYRKELILHAVRPLCEFDHYDCKYFRENRQIVSIINDNFCKSSTASRYSILKKLVEILPQTIKSRHLSALKFIKTGKMPKRKFRKKYCLEFSDSGEKKVVCRKTFLAVFGLDNAGMIKSALKNRPIHKKLKSGIECQQCGKVVESQSNLDDHLREHSMLELFCSYCPQTFTIKANLNYHEAFHIAHHHAAKEPNPESAPPHKKPKRNADHTLTHICCICGKQLAKKCLKIHMRMHNSLLQEMKVECKLCGRIYKSERHLKVHINRLHKKLKPYVCDQCGKAFDNKPSLDKHMRIHTGEMPFQCSFCDKKFRCPYNRAQHENVHTGIKKYECEFCSKRFVQTAALIQHRRQHTGFKVTEEYERIVAQRALELASTSAITETASL